MTGLPKMSRGKKSGFKILDVRTRGQARRFTPVVPALRRLRQEYPCTFETSLSQKTNLKEGKGLRGAQQQSTCLTYTSPGFHPQHKIIIIIVI